MDRITLFCIPHAGCSAAGFNKWRRVLDPSIVCTPLELSGRGTRIREPLYDSVAKAVDDVLAQLQAKSKGGPYAIFGHSLGGLLGFEVAHRLQSQGWPAPEHIFFSACRPPSRRLTGEVLHVKPDREFIDAIVALGGTPDSLLQDRDVLEFFTPIIKSDYRLFELYQLEPKAERLACPISVLMADRDSMTIVDELPIWNNFTTGPVHTRMFADAGHFFIDQRWEEVVRFVNVMLG